ncbi:hypothetical protein DY245_02035 [Streptomyces inhibens]|uniref:Uncharacterized protein n=1 Tax=Streptomyces inhibens TaxID=2293571 RepID=A0A371QB19_STRIH|nr:hypothetical protein [Streptomyces inhibens]REK91848.1 hypothetical protein DY245_02035 [Streptomyces inhibens]
MTTQLIPHTPSRPDATGPSRSTRRARHPVFAEIRGGLAPWIALAMCLTLVGAMTGKASYWQGSWGETQERLHSVAVLLGGPLAAGAGCWQGGRERRRRTAELWATGARSELAQFAVAALPVALAVIVGHAVAAAGSFLATWPYASAGRPLFGPLAADTVFLAAMSCGGMVVGRLVRWRLAAPLLTLCGYVALALPTYRQSSLRFLGPAEGYSPDAWVPVWWQPLAMAAWTGGLAAAAVLGHAARRHRYTALLPLAVAIVAAVPIGRTGEHMWYPNPLAEKQICDDSSPQVCVNAVHGDLLPAVSKALSGLTGRLEGVAHTPVRFEDLPQAPHRDEAQLPELYLGQSVVRGELADPQAFAWEAAAGMLTRDCVTPTTHPVDEAVMDWLVSNDLSTSRRAEARRQARERGDTAEITALDARERALHHLAAMHPDQRRAWLGRYFATHGSCDTKKVPAL